MDSQVRTIGQRVRQIRHSRGKSLRVVAGLAGISTTKLWRIEHGEYALDSRQEIGALAKALGVRPNELTKLPVPAPANGNNEDAISAVRRALWVAGRNQAGGQVLPIEVLRSRVRALINARRECRQAEVGAALPTLILDLYTSIAAGRDVAELLDLAVALHVQGSVLWLRTMGAPLELCSSGALLARQAAERRDQPEVLSQAVFGDVLVLLAEGDFDLAQDALDSITVPTNSPESMQLAGMLALSQSLVAAADKRPADAEAALGYASELAQRTTGEGGGFDPLVISSFGPTNVGIWRMNAALEIGDHDRAAAIAESLNPEVLPWRSRQAAYWIDYGRALARLRGRQNDAVAAFHRAETLSPLHTLRNPFAREVLVELLPRTKRDSPAGRELRAMAYRADLPV